MLRKYWPQFKQDFLPLFYLIVMQIWWNFNFSPFSRLGTPLGTLVSAIVSIATTFVYISVFIFPEKYAPYLTLEYLDDMPNASMLKNIQSFWIITVTHVAAFFIWYKDLYGMSNTYYALCYVHCIIAFLLMAKVVNKYNNKKIIADEKI